MTPHLANFQYIGGIDALGHALERSPDHRAWFVMKPSVAIELTFVWTDYERVRAGRVRLLRTGSTATPDHLQPRLRVSIHSDVRR